MDQVTIGTKNQIVIPKRLRSKVAGLKPGRKVRMYLLDKETIAIKVENGNWLESGYGMMKQAWRKIDPIKELEKMRSEWER
jgi:AbrB family looped-hinge helix DNA binding protein